MPRLLELVVMWAAIGMKMTGTMMRDDADQGTSMNSSKLILYCALITHLCRCVRDVYGQNLTLIGDADFLFL